MAEAVFDVMAKNNGVRGLWMIESAGTGNPRDWVIDSYRSTHTSIELAYPSFNVHGNLQRWVWQALEENGNHYFKCDMSRFSYNPKQSRFSHNPRQVKMINTM